MATKWVKQLTRENTLLDRSLRTIAYNESLREIGRASISKSPVVGRGGVTSLYYSPADYRKQQGIIQKEFHGKNILKMGQAITAFLEQVLAWTNNQTTRRLSKAEFLKYLKEFNAHHAHSRGAIVYGYWGEPVITKKLKTILSKQLSGPKLDHTLSLLSAPKLLGTGLKKLYHPSAAVEQQKQKLMAKLKLSAQAKELVEILGWFTFFYELGERVSSLLYDNFLSQLSRFAGKPAMAELQWYDPVSLTEFIKGRRLPASELAKRKRCYVLIIIGGTLRVLSGGEAENYISKNFKETIQKNLSELTGVVASTGKAKGRVKIVITEADQRKINKGEILISTMTTPRLMTAVKKAAAIVTDEGGLTAHAAIVSRELGIPCIVGTKFATKIFKDNDLVEVDANSGTVKLLKKG